MLWINKYSLDEEEVYIMDTQHVEHTIIFIYILCTYVHLLYKRIQKPLRLTYILSQTNIYSPSIYPGSTS